MLGDHHNTRSCSIGKIEKHWLREPMMLRAAAFVNVASSWVLWVGMTPLEPCCRDL